MVSVYGFGDLAFQRLFSNDLTGPTKVRLESAVAVDFEVPLDVRVVDVRQQASRGYIGIEGATALSASTQSGVRVIRIGGLLRGQRLRAIGYDAQGAERTYPYEFTVVGGETILLQGRE